MQNEAYIWMNCNIKEETFCDDIEIQVHCLLGYNLGIKAAQTGTPCSGIENLNINGVNDGFEKP